MRQFLAIQKLMHYGTSQSVCLLQHLQKHIKAVGPMTVARYMREALTNIQWGYYMNRDVFGEKGDFTTSPEISQMFGELVGVWFLACWIQMGKPSPVQLVELGPGRGTLMSDTLRVFNQFQDTLPRFHVHLVEVSEKMRRLQERHLSVKLHTESFGETPSGVKVHWHTHLQDVPKGRSFFLAHEFFDALPIHMFQKVNGEFREILIGLNSNQRLHFVTAPGPSPIARTFIQPHSDVHQCEVSPQAAVLVSTISDVIDQHGGCALFIDYGVDESDRFSLRGFKDHKLVENVLEEPGSSDLTANVDFGFLRRFTNENVRFHGPITQQSFLLQMGIQQRLKVLLSNATAVQAKNLLSSFDHLTDAEKMGEKFKVVALTQKGFPAPHCFER